MERKSTLEKFLHENKLFFSFTIAYNKCGGINVKLFFDRHGEDPEALECSINFEKFPKWREINAKYQMYFNNKLN